MIFTWNGRGVRVHHRRARRGAARRQLRRRRRTSRSTTTSTSRFPASRWSPRDGALRDPHHRGAARGRLTSTRCGCIAVDHPADVEVFTNDKFKAPPFPEFRLFGVERRIHPVAARDDRGRDVARAAARAGPDATPTAFERDLRRRRPSCTPRARLRHAAAPTTGRSWCSTAGSTGPTAAPSSAPRRSGPAGLIMPSLAGARTRPGAWQTVIEDMGIPAGKPKTIVVDLTGKFLSAARARCASSPTSASTGTRSSWPRDGGARGASDASLTRQVAELRFRGFSRSTIHPSASSPSASSTPTPMPLSMWNPTRGSTPATATCAPLLDDDRRPPGDHGLRRRAAAALRRRGLAAAAGGLAARLPADGRRLGQGRRRQHRLLADASSRCPSTACRSYPYQAPNASPTTTRTGRTASTTTRGRPCGCCVPSPVRKVHGNEQAVPEDTRRSRIRGPAGQHRLHRRVRQSHRLLHDERPGAPRYSVVASPCCSPCWRCATLMFVGIRCWPRCRWPSRSDLACGSSTSETFESTHG